VQQKRFAARLCPDPLGSLQRCPRPLLDLTSRGRDKGMGKGSHRKGEDRGGGDRGKERSGGREGRVRKESGKGEENGKGESRPHGHF